MALSKQQIPEETLKRLEGLADALQRILIARPHESVAKIPGIFLEHVIRHLEPEFLQILDREHGGRAGVPLAERVYPPNSGDETGEVFDNLPFCPAAVGEFPFAVKSIVKTGSARHPRHGADRARYTWKNPLSPNCGASLVRDAAAFATGRKSARSRRQVSARLTCASSAASKAPASSIASGRRRTST